MRRERMWLLLILVAFTASVALAIARNAPFEVDESLYATQARAWAVGGPVTGILPHRAPLIPAIGTVLYKLGARAEWPFRLVGLAFGVTALVLVWAIAREVAGPKAGLVAAAVFASGPPLLLRSSQFMTDVPATAFLLALTFVLWRNRDEVTWSLLLAAPLAAGAFYARYASILPIGLIALAAILLWRRGLLSRPVLAGATVVIFAALLVPHILRAIDVTGRPWGLITFTARYASRARFGEGLRDYAYWLPFALAGPVAALTMIAGLVSAASKRERSLLFLVAVAVLDVVLIGATEHAETRFVFFPVALLCIAGATLAERARPAWILVAATTAAVALGGAFAVARTNTQRLARAAPRVAGAVVARRASRPCNVLAVDIGPTTWYTDCSTYYFNDPAGRPADFMVLYRIGGPVLQAQPDTLPLPAGPPIHIRDADAKEIATVYPVFRR